MQPLLSDVLAYPIGELNMEGAGWMAQPYSKYQTPKGECGSLQQNSMAVGPDAMYSAIRCVNLGWYGIFKTDLHGKSFELLFELPQKKQVHAMQVKGNRLYYYVYEDSFGVLNLDDLSHQQILTKEEFMDAELRELEEVFPTEQLRTAFYIDEADNKLYFPVRKGRYPGPVWLWSIDLGGNGEFARVKQVYDPKK